MFLPRTSVDSVYQQIIADFTDALNLFPNPKVPESGKMNKGVVAAELGLVYMTLKQWDKAVPLLQSVTTMGYDLVGNYRDIFDPLKKANKEAIFEVQYKSGVDGQQSIFAYRFLPVSDSTKAMLDIEYNNINGGWNTPTADLLRQYEANDKRLNASVGYIEGYMGANGVFKTEKIVTEDVRTLLLRRPTKRPGSSRKNISSIPTRSLLTIQIRTGRCSGSVACCCCWLKRSTRTTSRAMR